MLDLEFTTSLGLADQLLPSAGPSAGLSHCHAYDHLSPALGLGRVSSAHAAVATLWDFFDLVPYALERSCTGHGWARDGRLHYPNDALLSALVRDYPRRGHDHQDHALILRALSRRGLLAQEAHAPALGDGRQEREDLCNWLTQLRLPVATLLQLTHPPLPLATASHHWALAYGLDAAGVWLTLAGENLHLPWPRFMSAWQAAALSWPYNYYAIYTRA